MKKYIIIICCIVFPYIAFAQTAKETPATTSQNTKTEMQKIKEERCDGKFNNFFTLIPQTDCMIKKFQTGLFNLDDVLVYIKYIIELLIVTVSFVSVIFVIIGGYNYLLSFVIEDKESGKNTITNALIGLSVSILSWVIINSILYIVSNNI